MRPRRRTERSSSVLPTGIVNGPFELLETVDRHRSIFRTSACSRIYPFYSNQNSERLSRIRNATAAPRVTSMLVQTSLVRLLKAGYRA